ncbi:MAG: hypothetical protein ABSC31_13650 [Acidimicrobiales bacterium]|jgi:hypothetical protein
MPKLLKPIQATHAADAKALIDAVRLVRGDDFDAQDAAEANALLALAAVVDSNPSNIGALRELRITLDGFRRDAVRINPREQHELAELVAEVTAARPGVYEGVYKAVIDAGGSEDAAFAAANAATGNPDAIKYPRIVAGVVMED